MILVVCYFLGLLLSEPVVLADEKSINANSEVVSEWVCVMDNKGIALFERWIQVNESLRVRERRGEFVVTASLSKTIDYLSNVNSLKQWMKGVETVDKISSYTDSGELTYIVLHLPWPFADRDMIARFSLLQVDSHHCFVRINSEKGDVPEVDKIKRIHDYSAVWALEKLDAERTKVVFTVFSSEPPMFPQWLQEPILKKVFISNLKRLKQELSGE